ncbi:AbiA family abortive infection protein [Limosilactobacillus reuteri]|uniref:AbiA family abortive infection protein n=1 Tax=Limosilactobacillus reuteri TaxID=1598 RepID=A0AB36AG38_LIMRT|nr:AbiA family abortive infection protein [Limosilactobacillus reuteri]MCH5358553.1 AbiA family abortive infection protein [Limosilactobacillus reuteri]MRG84310.1 AbiA family abortive infection protein [Limosilactobacillus reuteri]
MENSSLFGINYNEWKVFVENFLNQDQDYMKNNIYSYPFARITLEEKEWLLSKNFFDSYISSGLFLNDDELTKYNTVDPKNNGDLRNITLISPIMYLVLITIGGHLAKQNNNSVDNDWISYAGNYKKGEMNYTSSYKNFSIEVLSLQDSYKYYLKTDIVSFYSTLNMGILFTEIQSNCANESARSLMFYRNLLEYFGDGRFPVISDNIGLSYIATEIYLKKFDELLIDKLKEDLLISNYHILRYVDDLYIAFNCTSFNYGEVGNHLKRYLQEVASVMNLKLNFQKQSLAETKNISDDVYANIYDYIVNDKDISYSNRYDEQQIINLINELINLQEYPRQEEVEKILISVLDDHKYKFYYTEVLNWYIYKNKGIFQNESIIEGLYKLVERIDILEYYPKQFGRMIINTCNDALIEKYLKKILELFKTSPTPKFIEFLAKEYLLEHNFNHLTLKECIKYNSPKLYQYIKRYCENNSFIPKPKLYKNTYLEKMSNDPILHYLRFMYRCADNESKSLEGFAYYKNYFDRKFAYFLAAMGEDGAVRKGKVSFQKSYKIKEIKKSLDNWKNQGLNYTKEDSERLSNIDNLRNENPLNHASSRLLYENNETFSELKKHILFLKKFLDRVENFIIDEVE